MRVRAVLLGVEQSAARVSAAVREAYAQLEEHMRRFPGQCCTPGTFASEEFDRLYKAWILARWDDGDEWVRSVWRERPA